MTRQGAPLIRRSTDDRLLLGVAGGLGEGIGVDPLFIRLALTALTLASGLGVVAYVGAWALSGPPGGLEARVRRIPETGSRPAVAVGCITLGLLLVLRDVGIWFGDGVVWPLVIAGCGSVLIWSRTGARRGVPGLAGGQHSTELLAATGMRAALGGLMVLGGAAVFVLAHTVNASIGTEVVAVIVTAVGVVLILTPWILGLAREAAAERRARVRSEERAEIAAHLHDSVLNTLALIQRGEVSPAVAAVARRQERELRAWLNGGQPASEAVDLRTAIELAAARVEELHHVAVDVVVVGDAPLDEATNAIALACQEAATNAAKHSGAARISIYVEAEAQQVTAFVRDQGSGFDSDAVAADRRGIRESIIGRIRRLGGEAGVSSQPGEGTEVQMRVPRTGTPAGSVT